MLGADKVRKAGHTGAKAGDVRPPSHTKVLGHGIGQRPR